MISIEKLPEMETNLASEKVIKFKYSMNEHKKIAQGNRLQLEKLAFEYSKPTPKKKNKAVKATVRRKMKCKTNVNIDEEPTIPLKKAKTKVKLPLDNDGPAFFLEDMLDIFMNKKKEPKSKTVENTKLLK